jgi:hypothetical protein
MAMNNKMQKQTSAIGKNTGLTRRKDSGTGFALLIAVIFMSVMLTLGLALSSLGYKQQILASSAVESQYAFYAADAALECALYADQQQNLFLFPLAQPPSAPTMKCDGINATSGIISYTAGWRWIISERLSLGTNRCADVTIYKYRVPQSNGVITYIFSQGYNASCDSLSGSRVVSRGINISY